MPKLSDFSTGNLDTCRFELRETVIIVAKEFDVRVLEGRRSWQRQTQLFAEGRTTKVAGQSRHNPPQMPDGTEDIDWLSDAVDIAPYPIDWHDAKRFVYLAGLMIGVGRTLGYNIRWGGNWDEDQIIIDDQNFDDLPHFEYVGLF
jgi:hypothetical protein